MLGADDRQTGVATAQLALSLLQLGHADQALPLFQRALVVLEKAYGPDHRVLLPTSLFAGAAFVVLSDTIARLAMAPAEMPVGVVTALVGGPFFLFLLVREKGRARLWGGQP